MTRGITGLLAVALLGIGVGAVHAQGVQSPVQSNRSPFGLRKVGPVMQAGSDANAATFKADTLAKLRQFAGRSLNKWTVGNNAIVPIQKINPKTIKLSTAASVRAYFVSESDTFVKSLGFNTQGTGVGAGNPLLIFPDVATNTPDNDLPGNSGNRNQQNPLKPGDFVNLGNIGAWTALNFFLIADGNGVGGGRRVFSSDGLGNNTLHVTAYTLPGSPYLLLGLENGINGGDQDFNDTLLAFDIGAANVNYLSSPEPRAWVALVALLGVVAAMQARQKRRQRAVPAAL